jgi:2-dehydropantoate 2-reductase
MMLVFGVLGYLFKKLKLPAGAAGAGAGAGRHGRVQLPPGDAAVAGRLSHLLGNPLVGSLMALALVMLLWPAGGACFKDMLRGARRCAREDNDMKIAVVGAGAIGGYLGGRLALAGEEVTFIARNRNLEAIQANGLRLIEEDGTSGTRATVRACRRWPTPASAGRGAADVKAHQVKDVLPDMRGLFGPDTMVVTMQNGIPWWYFHKLAGPYEGRAVESVDPRASRGQHRARARDRQRRLPGVRAGRAGRVKVIEGNRFTLGELDGSEPAHRRAVAGLIARRLQGAGVEGHPQRDLGQAVGQPQLQPDQRADARHAGRHLPFPLTRALAAGMMREAQAVGEKLGVEFKIARQAHRRRRGGGRAQDLDAAGRRSRPPAGTRGAGRFGARTRPHHRHADAEHRRGLRSSDNRMVTGVLSFDA